MDTINLRITKDEAKMGCTKLVYPHESAQPVKVCIPPKAVDGQLYRLTLLAEGTPDLPDALFVRISVIRQRHAVDIISIVSAIVLIVSALVIYVGKTGDLFGKLSEMKSSVETAIPSVLRPTDVSPEDFPAVAAPSSGALRTDPVDELIPHFSSRYFLSGMNEDCLADFCAMYSAAMNFEELCELPRAIDSKTLLSMLTALQYECPELIQLDFSSNISYNYNKADSMVTSVILKYRLTPEEYEKKYAQCLAVIDFIKKETAGADDSAKELFVYNYFVANNSYDMDAEFASSAYGALVDHNAKCDGFSLALKWVLEELGIECICLRGEPVHGDIGHAWNMVKLGGSFYTVDVTADIQSEESRREPIYVAYNASSDWVAQYYTVSGGLELFREIPVCHTMGKSFHMLNGTFISSGENAVELFYSQLDSVRINGGYVMLQFESDSDRNAFIENVEQYYEQWALNNGGAPACVYSYTEMYNMFYLRLE